MERVLACFTLLALLGSVSGRAQDLAELEVDHALTLDYPTPHTKWAQPYAGGSTRVLFILDGRGTLPRECVELMQRFDLQAEAAFWTRIVDSTEEHWHGGDVGEARLLGLLGQPWDCVVLLQQGLGNMNAEQQYRLLRPVADGGGIVMVGRRDERVLKTDNRLAQLPAFLDPGDGMDAYRVGKGRGVHVHRRPAIDYYEGWETEYDLWAQRLGRAILWAAGREPAPDLALQLDSEPIRWGDWSHSVTVTAPPETPARSYDLVLRLRHATGITEALPAGKVESGSQARFRLPPLAAGDWTADAWLYRRGSVVTWAIRPFRVESPRTVEAVDLGESWSEVGGVFSGAVRLAGPAVAGEVLSVSLRDRRRRILLQDSFPNPGDTVPFRFPVEPWLPMLVTVEARLTAAGQDIGWRTAYARVTKRHHGRFNFLIWDVPKGTLAPYAEQSLAEHGVTLQLAHGNPPNYVAAFDMAWVPYTTRIQAKVDANGIMKPFCWNDADAVAKHVEERANAHLPARRHGVFVWSLGDEVDTQGCCASAACAAAYRTYLASQYASLSELNRSWGTSFAAWEEVGIADPADLEEAAALRAGNYARWFDRQAFQSWNFVQLCARYKAAYEAIDPRAKVGFEGAGRFERGDDLDLIVRGNTFWSPYPGTADEIIRSIAPRDFPRANWMGYTKDADSLLAKYWRMVTLDMDSVWWWRWDCIGRFHGWLAADLRPYPAVRDILEDTRVLRDGLGDLLLHSRMQDDGIAILYSYPSSLIHGQENGTSFGGYEAAHQAAHRLLRELGLNFRYVTDSMLRRDPEEALGPFRILLLPRTDALGDAEATAIREFVRRGGLLLADCRPGVFDGHCGLRSGGGVLDELFGIRRSGLPGATVVKETEWGTVRMDAAVSATDGRPGQVFDGIPGWITHSLGEGKAVLLNTDFASLPGLHLPGTPEQLAFDILLTFEPFGVLPEYAVVNAEGERERDLTITRWRNGDIELVSLFRSGGRPSKATVVLPRSAAVFDLRERRSRGVVKRCGVTILPNRATFLAVLPAKAPAPALAVALEGVPRGSLARATLSVPDAAGLHAFRIRAACGSEALPWHDRVVLAGPEPVSVPLPIASNDPTGKYRLQAIDLYTDEAASVDFDVR